MANKRYAQKKAEQFIDSATKKLINIYQNAVTWSEKMNASAKEFLDFTTNNGEFEELRGDSRERSRMIMMMWLLLFSIFIDFMLAYHALDILCSTTGLPNIIKYLAPVTLVFLEVFISYFSFTGMYKRGRNSANALARILPFAVLIIMAGFSISVIAYLLLNFGSTPIFSILTIIVQVILFIASTLLHLLIIKNSVEIGEMFAFGQYLIKRRKLFNRKEEDQNGYDTAKNNFMQECGMLEKDIYEFNTDFPDNTVDFTVGVPDEVVKATNRVMGRDIFRNINIVHAQIPD